MLDYKRLEANKLLVNAGWSRPHKNHWQERLAHLDPRFPLQVPADEVFESARVCTGRTDPSVGGHLHTDP